MSRPIALKSGIYRFNVRVPADVAGKVARTRVSLPFDGSTVMVVATDKVAFSLRTKNALVAKERFAEAYAALSQHFANVRVGPRTLTHKQAVALAGDVYRRRAAELEDDPDLTPAAAQKGIRQLDQAVEGWRDTIEDGHNGEISMGEARLLSDLQRPSGAQRLAWETQADVEAFGERVTLEAALEHLFGHHADAVCAEHRLLIDARSRALLLGEIGKAVHDAARKLARNLEGDYAPDPAAARFPDFAAPPKSTSPQAGTRKAETIGGLFERWVAYHADKRSAATIRRYGPSVASLDAWAKGRDWRSLTDEDVFAWAQHRCKTDGIAPATVNRNDLVAVSSVLSWPMSLAGGKLSTVNAAAGLKLDLPKLRIRREKMFREAERSAILRLAQKVEIDPRHPQASASRRWCPWLCAYSGARVQETLWLRKEDVRREAGIWILDFQQTKDGVARRVPIHQALVDEGFLKFVACAPNGFLFVSDKPTKEGKLRSAQELRGAELASWVKSKVPLDGVSPNHGWRHTWITLAEAAGIPKRFSNRITGHNASQDASDRYVNGLVELLDAEMKKFPRYRL